VVRAERAMRLSGGTATEPSVDTLTIAGGNLAPGATASLSFTARVEAARLAQFPDAGYNAYWGRLEVLVYEGAGTAAEQLIDQIELLHMHDLEAPHSVTVLEPAGLLRQGANSFSGTVGDFSGARLVELQLRGGITSSASCADPTPADLAWACSVEIGNLPDGAQVELRARATDIHGQTGAWSAWRLFVVDAADPVVELNDDSAASSADGAIGPGEAVIDGTISDNRLPSAVLVCDEVDGSCEEVAVELDDNAGISGTTITSDEPEQPVALGGAPACGATPFERSFVVADAFTVDRAQLGLRLAGLTRDALRVTLRSPAGTTATLFDRGAAWGGDGMGASLLFDDAAWLKARDDRSDHDPLGAYGDNPLAPGPDMLERFAGEAAAGTWTLGLCKLPGASLDAGSQYLSGALFLQARALPLPTTGTWSYTVAVLAGSADQAATLSFAGIDAAGNQASGSAAPRLALELDATVPTLSVAEFGIDPDGMVNINGGGSDTARLRSLALVWLSPSGETDGVPMLIDEQAGKLAQAGAISWRSSGEDMLSEYGSYTLWLEGEDTAGNRLVLPVGELTRADRQNSVFLPMIRGEAGPTLTGGQPIYLPMLRR